MAYSEGSDGNGVWHPQVYRRTSTSEVIELSDSDDDEHPRKHQKNASSTGGGVSGSSRSGGSGTAEPITSSATVSAGAISGSDGNASGSSVAAASLSAPTFGRVQRLDLPGGVLDDAVLFRVAAIAQQSNCVGVDGRGLAAGVAQKLPYGCSYRDRRPMPPIGPSSRVASKFAVLEDRATPGTVDVRRPPVGIFGVGSRPLVLNMFAQFEMGPPGKYRRVTPMPDDNAAERVAWFGECLARIAQLKLPSVAFPHEIGCGLAGGNWPTYNQMLVSFAQANPRTEVFICRWTEATPRPTGMNGAGGGSRAGVCFKCGQHGHWANRCPV